MKPCYRIFTHLKKSTWELYLNRLETTIVITEIVKINPNKIDTHFVFQYDGTPPHCFMQVKIMWVIVFPVVEFADEESRHFLCSCFNIGKVTENKQYLQK